MVRYTIFAAAGLAVALPLNINLGAYSPALVVGDGEISFGGQQDVSNLMNALEGAAVNAATGVTNGAGTPAAAGSVPAPEGTVPEATQPAVANAAADPTLQDQAAPIAAIQGMGKKEIDPRVEADTPVEVAKRDLAGFDRALKFAETALEKGPDIQLGTGAEGSGVGIFVDNNPPAAGARAPGAAGGEAPAAKRDLADEASSGGNGRVRARVTTMYVRSGIPVSLQSPSRNLAARDLPPAAAVSPASVPAVPAAAARDAIDAVNLNVVDGQQGVTMTFVETVADDEE